MHIYVFIYVFIKYIHMYSIYMYYMHTYNTYKLCKPK